MNNHFIIHGGQVYLSAASIIESSIQNAKVKDAPDQDVSQILERFVEIIRSTDLGRELGLAPKEVHKFASGQVHEACIEGAMQGFLTVLQDFRSQYPAAAPVYAVSTAEAENGMRFASGLALTVGEGFPDFAASQARESQEKEDRLALIEQKLNELETRLNGPKIGIAIRSNDFVEGVSGWELNRLGHFRIFGGTGVVSSAI